MNNPEHPHILFLVLMRSGTHSNTVGNTDHDA